MTERWHYAEWDNGTGGDMLVDRIRDPHELTNLADDPTHARDKAAMKALLAKLPE
jgi:arylsulfatase A-like enzyme